jgi:hypothetical protein
MAAKGPRGKADRLFSRLVLSRGVCEAVGCDWHPKCGGRLETSHMISRRYSHTRVLADNALCLCAAAHRFVGADPGAHYEIVAAKFGAAHWLYLRAVAAKRKPVVDWPAEVERLSL